MNKYWYVLFLLVLTGMVFATNTITITAPTAGEIVTVSPYTSGFSISSTTYASWNCSYTLNGASAGTSAVVLNNTATTKAITLQLSQASSNNILNFICSNASTTVNKTVVFNQAFIPTYASDDYVTILFDALGTGGAFIVQHETIIGEVLLALFVVGAIAVIYYKLKHVVS